jgi:DNA-binding NtrC family response regulator
MILAIDDDLEILDALRRALASTGVPVLTTDDPEQVFALLASHPVELIISDIDMPAMNGLDLVRRVRAEHPAVVRVLLSGCGTFDVARRAINEGEVHRFLSKPFEPAELKRVVLEALARHDDLARISQSGVAAERRRALLQQLENEHPGITQLVRDADGVYLVNGSRAAWAQRALTRAGLAAGLPPSS